MHDLAIVIVTWNAMDYIDDCLRSIERASTRLNLRTVVVDNGSTDGTLERIAAHSQAIDVIRNNDNVGFAAANNQAMRIAPARFTLLLNPDTIVRENALGELAGCFDEHPDWWAAGPAMFNADGTRQRTGVKFPNNWNIFVESLFLDRLFPSFRIFGRHREYYADPTRSREVDFLQGACLMVRREAIERVGGMDEEFFMYFEETDWCFRFHESGGVVGYCPAAQVVHLGGGEMGHYDEKRILHYHESLLLFYRKHYSTLRSLGLRFILIMRSLIRIPVWSAMGIVMPSLRSKAMSEVRGYIRVVGILFGKS